MDEYNRVEYDRYINAMDHRQFIRAYNAWTMQRIGKSISLCIGPEKTINKNRVDFYNWIQGKIFPRVEQKK